MNPLTLLDPITSANLGSGFDTIGMAVSLCNIFKVMLPEKYLQHRAHGGGAKELSEPAANLVVKAYEIAYERWGLKGPGFFTLVP